MRPVGEQGQRWLDTGTRFEQTEGGHPSFRASDGESYTLHQRQQASGEIGIEIRGANGQNVAEASVGRNADNSFSVNTVRTVGENAPRGLARGIYDYVHRMFGDVTPSEGGRTGAGKKLWEGNARQRPPVGNQLSDQRTAREQVTSLEADHLQTITAMNAAQSRLAGYKNQQAIGGNKAKEINAARKDIAAAKQRMKLLERTLDKQRGLAAIEEAQAKLKGAKAPLGPGHTLDAVQAAQRLKARDQADLANMPPRAVRGLIAAPLATKQGVWDNYAAGNLSPMDAMDRVIGMSGLDPHENHVLRQWLDDSSYNEIRQHPAMAKEDGTAYAKQRMGQLLESGLGKLGLTLAEGQQVRKSWRARKLAQSVANGKQLSPGEISFDPAEVKKQVVNEGAELEAAHDRLQDRIIQVAMRDGVTLSDLGPLLDKVLAEAQQQEGKKGNAGLIRAAVALKASLAHRGQAPAPPVIPRQPAGSPQRIPQQPPPVPNAPAPAIPGGQVANAPEGAGGGRPPVGSAPAPSGGNAVADNVVRSPEQVAWGAAGAEQGVPADHLHSRAAEIVKEAADHLAEMTAFRKMIWKEFPKLRTVIMRAGKGLGVDAVRELDDIAQHRITGEWHNLLGHDPAVREERLLQLLQTPVGKPISEDAAYRQALVELVPVTREEVTDVNQAAARRGDRPYHPAEIDAAREIVSGEAGEGEERGEAWEHPADRGPTSITAPGGAPDIPGVPFRHAGTELAARPGAPGIEQRIPDTRGYPRRSGAIDLTIFKDLGPVVRDWWQGFYDAVEKMGGVSLPKTTRMNRDVATRMMEWGASSTYAKEAGPVWARKILGEHFTDVLDRGAASALYELRFRTAKENLRKLANAALARGDKKSAAEYDTKAQAITTVFGMPGSMITDEAQYQRIVNSPVFGQIMTRYVEFGRVLDTLYTKANGKPPDSITQIPGLPFNAKVLQEGDLTGEGKVYRSARGKLRNIRQKKDPFSEEAGLDAEAYDLRISSMIQNSLDRRTNLANRAEANREIVAQGLGFWGNAQSERTKGDAVFQEVPFVKPPKGTQEAIRGMESLYLHPNIFREYLQLLDYEDRWWQAPAFSDYISPALTAVSLASTTEFLAHTANNLTAMMQPGMRFRDFFNNFVEVAHDTPAIRDAIVELARINAMKERNSVESGSIYGGKTFGILDKPLPAKADPTYWMGRFLDNFTRAMRLTAGNAHDRLAAAGKIKGGALEKANFINKLTGNYNELTQSRLVQFLRNTGIGPFAVAAANFNARAWDKVMLFRTGHNATSAQADLFLRSSMLMKFTALLVGASLVNLFAWGRWDGDDNTPFGAILIGHTADGQSIYLDPQRLTGFRRAGQISGVSSLVEGIRQHKTPGQTIDRMVPDIAHGLFHPAMGPAVSFIDTALTGENSIGMRMADRAAPGESQRWNNLMAAIRTANPPIATLTGFDRPREQHQARDAFRLMGSFGPQFRGRTQGGLTDAELARMGLRR
jgi:hypothetical protein